MEAARRIAERTARPTELGQLNNRGVETYADRDPRIRDFYDRTDPLSATKKDVTTARTARAALEPEERAALSVTDRFYVLTFENKGGLVSPVIVKFTFKDGTSTIVPIPAEIWRRDARRVNWTYMTAKEVTGVEIDPRQETADVERSNNYFPARIEPSRLEVYRDRRPGRNQMKEDDLTVTPESLDTKPAVTTRATPAPARPTP